MAAVVLDAGLAALLASDVVRGPRGERLQLHRDLPPVARIGRSSPVTLRLHNPTDRPLRVAIRDASPPSLGRDPARHLATLGPGAWRRLEASIHPSRRGHATVGPITVRTEGPLGLGGRQRTVPLVGRVRVYPALPGREEVELRLDRARLLQSGQRSSAIRGGGTDFESLREYHPDDEFRRINWRATARAAKTISNVYREERNQQVILLLDASRMMAATVQGVSRFEHALDASVAVAELAARIGDLVGMVAFGTEVMAMLGPRGGRAHPKRILDALFDLEPTLEAPNYGRAFAALLSRHRRRALLVLLTELTEESAMEALFEAIPSLRARHLVVVGSVMDPELVRLAESHARSSEAVYLKAAAAGSLLARERAGGRLQKMGVAVLDRPPGKLAGALADHYLRIKAYGRL